jgi:hypothetical protein
MYRMKPSVAPDFGALLPGAVNKTGFVANQRGEKSPEVKLLAHKRTVWLVMGCMGTCFLLMFGVILTMRGGGKDASSSKLQEPIIVEDGFEPGNAKDWKGPVPRQIADSFSKATTHEERLKWVRDPLRVAPLMERFFRDGLAANEKILEIVPMTPASNGALAFQRFQVRLENGKNRLLSVVLTDEGGKVDFECYARHGAATWNDLLSGKASESSEVRVFVEPGFAYMHDFFDDQKWRSILATTPDYEYPLYFYVLRESEVGKKLKEHMDGKQMRATLAIRSVQYSHEKKQFEVTEVLSPSWVR